MVGGWRGPQTCNFVEFLPLAFQKWVICRVCATLLEPSICNVSSSTWLEVGWSPPLPTRPTHSTGGGGMSCDVVWYDVMSFDQMWNDALQWDWLLCGCDVKWLAERTYDVMQCGCVAWWIRRWCACCELRRARSSKTLERSIPTIPVKACMGCKTAKHKKTTESSCHNSTTPYYKALLRTAKYYSVLQSSILRTGSVLLNVTTSLNVTHQRLSLRIVIKHSPLTWIMHQHNNK